MASGADDWPEGWGPPPGKEESRRHRTVQTQAWPDPDQGSVIEGDQQWRETVRQLANGAVTVRLSDVEPERVSWLWPGYLPRGKLVILDGDPGVAKSTLCLDLAARVSTGVPMPDGTAGGEPRDVLLLSAEDGLADTIRPRLEAAGADASRVHALTEVTETRDDGTQVRRPPSLPADLALLERVVVEHRVVLVVVDVLMAYLGAGVDSHRDQDVRGVLHQLAAIADRRGCTVVLVRHLNKSTGSSAMYRGGGSIGIIGAARAAFLAAVDPEDDTGRRRVFAPVKMNLAPMPPALSYTLVSDPIWRCAAIEWGGASAHSAAVLLREPAGEDERTERDDAVKWLRTFLTDRGGEAPVEDVLKAGRAVGYSVDQLKRVKRRAGVDSHKLGFGGAGPWAWRLDPAAGIESTKDAKSVGSGEPLPSPAMPHPLADEWRAGRLAKANPCTECRVPLAPEYVAKGWTAHPYPPCTPERTTA